MIKSRFPELAALVAILLVGLFLRTKDIDVYRMSPDEGNYLFSAQVHLLSASDLPGWLQEDREWIPPAFYPHSYLHQWLARWWFRLGAGAVASIRLSSAVLGTLTALALYRLHVRAFPDRRGPGLLAAAILGLHCFHVTYARTGWGTSGCTFFFVCYLGLGYTLLSRPGRLWTDLALGLGMAVVALLAWGFHEMVAVHVAGMGAAVLLAPLWRREPGATSGSGPAGWGRAVATSRKTWVYALSTLPIALLVTRLFLTSGFASRHWLDVTPAGRGGFWAVRWQNLHSLFAVGRLDLQLGHVLLLLALVGVVAVFRRDRFYALYVTTAFLASCGIFLLLYKDARLARIYLPTAALLSLFAAEGLCLLTGLLPLAAQRAGTVLASAALALWLGATSYQTLFADEGAPFFDRAFHPGLDAGRPITRDVHVPWVRHLEDGLAAGELVGVPCRADRTAGEVGPLFRLLDAGIRAQVVLLGVRGARDPRFVVAVKRLFEQDGYATSAGGPYRLVVADTWGRIALYEREAGR